MAFGMQIAITLGALTFISLFTTVSLGILYYHFKKNVFKYHRFFAFTTASLAILHAIFVYLWLSGAVI
jgi:hypothetical protein